MSDIIPCPHKVQVRTKSGRVKKPVEWEPCPGHVEAATKVFLDVIDAQFNDEGVLIIQQFGFSHVNDHYMDHPCNMESELDVSCTEGHQIDWNMGEFLRGSIAPQPVGDAPRELGHRGGT